jgi:hypothetical protein
LALLAVLAVLPLCISVCSDTPGHKNGVNKAKVELADLCNAISAYESDYQRLPCSISDTNGDLTFGIDSEDIQNFRTTKGTRIIESNSDVIVVLMDLDTGANAGHKLNPKQIKYLNAKTVADKSSGVSTIDFQYRDPWGDPYVISLDANGDGFVRDACYANMPNGSGGTGLQIQDGFHELKGPVMIWSRGWDVQVRMASPPRGGGNWDNVVSWQ